MNGLLNKAWRIVKEEAVGLPMALLTLVVVFAVIRWVRAALNAKTAGSGDKLASYFTV